MRNSFVQQLLEIAATDERVVLMTADLGFSVLEPFAEQFPKRFFNVGVSEQNMLGMATGLGEAGFIPFVYSIATFAVLRPYEFIRNGPILHQTPVRVVAVGAGYEYGNLGTTHHLIEDLALLRSQPGIDIAIPADGAQAKTILAKTYALPKPLYYRLGKDEKITLPAISGAFDINNYPLLHGGKDVLIVSLGPAANEANAAILQLAREGIQASLLVIDYLSAETSQKLLKHLKTFDEVVSVEDHYINGGIGSAVAEVIAENGLSCRLKRLGANRAEDGLFGSREFMYKKFGFDAAGICQATKQLVASTAKKVA